MVYTYMVKKLLGCFMMFYDCVLPTLDQNSDNDDNDQSDNWIMMMITMKVIIMVSDNNNLQYL